MPVRLVARCLQRHHHVRKLEVEERVVATGDVAQRDGEVTLLGGLEIRQPAEPVAARAHGDLVRPPRRKRHGGDEARARRDDSGRMRVDGRRGAGEAAAVQLAMAAVRGVPRRDERRDVVDRVDLSVRVRDGGAHLRAAVLEDEDVLVRGVGPELRRAICPDREHARELGRREHAEGRVVTMRVQDDLAAAAGRSGRTVEERRRRRVGPERGEAVVEDRRLVRERYLGAARAERAVLAIVRLDRRVQRPHVPRRRDPHPRLGEDV